jgi:small subunit ribosomal protein S1
MTWDRRVRDPSSLVSEGDHVRVVVLEIDRKRRRISLGMKQVDGDPWADVRSRFPRNSVVKGSVERVESFGVLLKLAEGVVGLIPNGELGTPRGTDHVRMFPVGTEIDVLVKEIDLGARRIRLSKKSAKMAQERAEYRELSAQVRESEDKPLGSLGDLFGGLKFDR